MEALIKQGVVFGIGFILGDVFRLWRVWLCVSGDCHAFLGFSHFQEPVACTVVGEAQGAAHASTTPQLACLPRALHRRGDDGSTALAHR